MRETLARIADALAAASEEDVAAAMGAHKIQVQVEGVAAGQYEQEADSQNNDERDRVVADPLPVEASVLTIPR
ncbi:hypothetical protein [Streptomyces sp. NBC_00183]|uniref:hypothetical protein n=1 Tax=unclassified Streptomyces TaxID=2593676 RepID=UPI002251EDD7|nr:hypothetical protein [Streptomyces sp. NBC_00183]MCX5288206.1 hypothetical protein [Streptomyces sp. NBC_00183]